MHTLESIPNDPRTPKYTIKLVFRAFLLGGSNFNFPWAITGKFTSKKAFLVIFRAKIEKLIKNGQKMMPTASARENILKLGY